MPKFSCTTVLLSLLLMLSTNNVQASTTETTADVLRIAIPAAAWGLSQYYADDEGTKQFYYGFATNIAVTYGLKMAISKQRPNGEDDDAFPSGHASMAFQGAAFIQQRYGWKQGAAAYALATYVGYSRVKTDQHDSRDVLAGAAVGILSSYFFTTRYQGFAIQPYATSNMLGLNISKRW
ncbi:phosphatase PAP2 family protein [Rheinheimera salexigens]|uniref:undecaprenyl-diphosphate phosphatase n=1 Tax=Rheinheimera salexigens TaxID=1628148 RepID=A0A1E7Q3E1_9GAMM|nr:phosphatase PAP2 family protein [Rheinheimera salexigens]OEY68568.1 phosphatase PAP2 family protein [Rheinheimera salexigens]